MRKSNSRILEITLVFLFAVLGIVSLRYTGYTVFNNESTLLDIENVSLAANISDTNLSLVELNVSAIEVNSSMQIEELSSENLNTPSVSKTEEYFNHEGIEINQPVKWDYYVTFDQQVDQYSVQIPRDAFDILFTNEKGEIIENITRVGEANLITGGIVRDVSRKGFFGFFRNIFRFTGFTLLGELNHEPAFSPIPYQNLQPGTRTILDLSSYATDPDADDLIYGATGLEHIEINITGSLVTFTPDPAFVGSEMIWFSVSDGNATAYSKGVELHTGIFENTTEVPDDNATLVLEDLLVQDEIPLVIPQTESNITFTVHEPLVSLSVHYKTPGPIAREQSINPYLKRIKVSNPLQYSPISVYTNLSLRQGSAHVYLVSEENRTSYSSNVIDGDGDGINDKIIWEMNNEESTFEVEIIILTVHSYPTIGGNWTVEFQTVGTADLMISAVEGTRFSYENITGDLEFLGVRCGSTLVETSFNSSVSAKEYSCENIGFESSKVITAGKHNLEFRFGDQVAYAYNTAWGTDDCSIPGYDRLNYATIRRCGVLRENSLYKVKMQIYVDNRSTAGMSEVSVNVYSIDPSILYGDINVTQANFALADAGESDCCAAYANGTSYKCLDQTGAGSGDCGRGSTNNRCNSANQLLNQSFCINSRTTQTDYDWANFTVTVPDIFDPDCLNFTLTSCANFGGSTGFAGCLDGNNNTLTIGKNYSLTYGDACTVYGGLGVSLDSPINASTDIDGNVAFNCTAWDANTSIVNLSFFWNYPGVFRKDYTVDPAETLATPSNKMQVLLHLNNDSYIGENSTFVVDSLAGKYNGTYSRPGAPLISDGQLLGGLRFNGTGGYVNLSYIDALAQENVTVSAWTTTDYIVASENDPVVAQYTGLSKGYWLGFLAGRPRFELSGTAAALGVGQSITGKKWYHLVGTHNTTHLVIYVNGTFINSVAKTGIGVVTSAYLGYDQDAKGGTSDYLNGSVDEVVIYNRTLSFKEVQDLYASYTSNQTFMSQLFTRTNLSIGTYQWNCQAYNNLSENVFALTNNTLYITNSAYPNVSLSYPADRISTSGTSVTFACNASDDYDLTNLTLYWNYSGNFAANETIWTMENIDSTNASFWIHFNGINTTVDNEQATTASGITYESGRIERSAYFKTGSDLRFNLGDNFNKTRGTLAFWIQINQSLSTGNNIRYLFRNNKNASDDFSILTSPKDDFLIVNYSGGGVNTTLKFGNDNQITNNWSHVAVSWNTTNGNLLKVYRNGNLVATGTSFQAMEDVGSVIQIGGWNGGQNFNGSIDEMVFFNDRILTDSDVMNLYQAKNSLNATFTLTNLNDGSILWNCQASDNTSQVAFAVSNRTITIGDDVPIVNLSQPNNNKIFPNLVNLLLECNVTEDNEIMNISLYHNMGGTFVLNQTIDPRETIPDSNKMHVLLHLNNDSSLGENSTFAVDSMGNNNGTFSPGQPKIDAGKFNRGMTFIGNSATGQINLTNVDALRNVNVTVMAWVKSGDWNAADDASKNYPIIAQRPTTSIGYMLWVGTTGGFRSSSFRYGATLATAKDINLSINTWYHLVGTHNDTDLSIYVNGVFQASTAKTTTLTSKTQAGYIGHDDLSNAFFNGTIDEVVIYNRTLSANEISAYYTYTKTSYSANFSFPNFDQTGTHSWNCLAVDTGNQKSWGYSNRTFTVDSCTPPLDANWLVNKVCYKNNTVVSPAQDYSLNISAEGRLHFSNATLLVNQTSDGSAFVYVSGVFNITRKSNITSINPAFEFDFQILPGGNLTAKDSYFSEMGYQDNTGLFVGSPASVLINNTFTEIREIILDGENHTFVNNRVTFQDASVEGIDVGYASSGNFNNISGNFISGVSGGGVGDTDIGLLIAGSNNKIFDNTITNINATTQHASTPEVAIGVYIFGGDSNLLIGNNISRSSGVATFTTGNPSNAIYIDSGSTNNTIINNSISYNLGNYDGIFMVTGSTGTRIINNSIYYNDRDQIVSGGSSLIANNKIEMNGRQIVSGTNARGIKTGGSDNITENIIRLVGGVSFGEGIYVSNNNNNISSNNITTNCISCSGILLFGGRHNRFTGNNVTISGGNAYGIDFLSGSQATGYNNFTKTGIITTSLSGARGISIDNGFSSANNTFNFTTVVSDGVGVYIGSPNNAFYDLNVSGNPALLLITSAINNTVIGLTFNSTTSGGDGIGIRISGSAVKDNLIKNFNGWSDLNGIQLDANPSNTLFLDGEVATGTDPGDNSLYLLDSGGGRVNTFRNVTFIKNITTFSNADNYIVDKQWYLDVFVNYSNATNAVNVNVSSSQINGSLSFSTLTQSTGYITTQNVTEYLENASNRIMFTNYTINATQPGFVNLSYIQNISYNTQVYLTFADVSPSIPTLIYPTVNNYTTNRTPEFSWNPSTDIENDPIVYDLILECLPIAGGTCSSDNRVFANLTGTSLILPGDIRLLQDNGWKYNWTVRAWDNKTYSNNATKRNLTVASLIAISLSQDAINFTSLIQGESATSYNLNQIEPDTTLNVSNDGNALTNISITETLALWGSPNKRADQYSFNVTHADPAYRMQGNACSVGYKDWGYGTAAWFPIPGSATMGHICQLNYLNGSNKYPTALVYINITVPSDEPGGQKGSRLTFTAYLAE